MKELSAPGEIIRELEDIYSELQELYETVAEKLEFTCSGCPDNCCDSYFLHHTYLEWLYLWKGFCELDEARQQELRKRCLRYIHECERMEAEGVRPQVMCPLNENNLCTLYRYRMLVCRTHGVPATMTRPDGRSMRFPGCFRCQEIVEKRTSSTPPPMVDRTALFNRLAGLEHRLLEHRRHLLPRVRMTIAEMIIKGPPMIP